MEERQLFLMIFIILVLIIFLVLALLLLFNVSQKRVLNEVTKAQEREIEFANTLLKNSIETQEDERNRIARELHDGVTSKLNIINLNINYLKSKINEDGMSVFTEIKDSINESINLTREISHNLIPPAFSKFGIKSALEDLVIQVNRSEDLDMKLDIDHSWEILPKMQLLHVFRIIQELINNTIKHANATSINLESKLKKDLLMITYSDNGIGIDIGKNQEDGIGIKNIKSRLKLLSAETTISSKDENGGYLFQTKIPYINKQK